MNKKLYLVRHGETEFNREGKLQGQADSPLTPTGIEQAKKLKKVLDEKGLHFKTAYASDLDRAIETLKLITDEDTRKFAVPGLREVSFGDLDGKSKSEFPLDKDWEEVYQDYHGESFDQAVDRMFMTLLQIANKDEDDDILIVTHSGVIAGLLEKMGLDLKGPIPNGSVSVMQLDDEGLRLIDFFGID